MWSPCVEADQLACFLCRDKEAPALGWWHRVSATPSFLPQDISRPKPGFQRCGGGVSPRQERQGACSSEFRAPGAVQGPDQLQSRRGVRSDFTARPSLAAPAPIAQ